jgi:hypothetical protein
MEQSVIFTLLPQDVVAPGADCRASVFVSPRLTPDAPGAAAADFPAFADWPAVVSAARIELEARGGESLTVAANPDGLRSDLWRTYLAPIPVRGWSFRDLSQTDLRSYPAQAIHALAQGLYAAVAAASQGRHPDPLAGGLRSLGAAYADLGSGGDRDAIVDARLSARSRQRFEREHGQRPREAGGMAPQVSALAPQKAVSDAGDAALDLAEARRFYDRPEARDSRAHDFPRPDPQFQPAQIEKAEPDFHDVLGALADHPELLRALGIVVEIVLPSAFVAAGGDFRVTLRHDTLANNPITVQPWTRAAAAGDFFQPVSETGDFRDGVLALDDPNRFDVAQVDVDSAAMLVEQRVANVHPIAHAASSGQPVTGDLPALRSTGFTVTRLRRAMILGDRVQRAKDNADKIAAGADVVLFAEDLFRGFRVEVNDGSAWRSLMHRTVSYLDRDTQAEVFAVADQEAYLKGSAVTSVPGAAVDRSYLHESMFGWDGWSLALPRPGRHIRGTAEDPGSLAEDGQPFPGPLALRVRTGLIAGTLPRLRYGSSYRFRVRAVDLGGYSTPYLAEDPATAPDAFRRFQPISHPTVVPRHAFTEGESSLCLVIRSGVGADNSDPSSPVTPVDPATYAATLAAATPRTFAQFRPDSQRHLAAPKTSQQEAELLGRFDDAIGLPPGAGSAAYRAAFARARREQGTLADTLVLDAADPHLTTPAAGIHLVPPLARDSEFTPAALDASLAALTRGEAPDPGFVIIHDTDQLALPYLPDPLAVGVALRFTGAGTAAGWAHLEVVSFNGAWPDLLPYRLRLADGPAADVSVAGNLITVTLPAGGRVVVRSSSSLADAQTLELLGIWDWIAATVPAAQLPDVVQGGHQMITPGEPITLIHATQRPLIRPALESGFAPVRAYGDTFTRFTGVLRSQSATTGRLDVAGSWAEWFDEPASAQPPSLVAGRNGHAFDLTVPDAQDDVQLDAADQDLRHEFRDHKHRKVTYSASATTRFREYLPAAATADIRNLQVVGPGSTIHVPNSARPAVPVVHSVIPTFTWTDEPVDRLDPLSRARSRSGGLRVWLERPWYTSGEDEQLGVVFSGADAIVGDADLRRHYVTLWGKDPIRIGGQLPAATPRPRDFSGEGLLELDRLSLAETDNRHPGVTVLGHPVQYSPERDKWYADLTIDPGETYWSFLRLGLSRFQPYSVPDAHLSPVAVVDFVQLTNRRTAAITRPDANTVKVTVTGIEESRPTPGIFAQQRAPIRRPPPLVFAVERQSQRGVRAWIEQRGTTPSDLDWNRVGDVIDLARIDEDEVMRVWSGDVPLLVQLPMERPGTDPDSPGSDWRLVLTEWESLRLDTPDDTGGAVERIVYLDRFPL